MKLEEIKSLLTDFVLNNKLNSVNEIYVKQIFAEPLVGIASADDPLFLNLKREDVIGPNHMLPSEWLAEGQSIVSYFLPFSQQIREAERKKGLPAIEWAYGRIEGEELNNATRNYLAEELTNKGLPSLSPFLDKPYKVRNMRANWSERHAAYIAGLGTFGLSKCLITEKGAAGRFGSVVVAAELEPTVRPYEDIYENCTFCGACITRCNANAIDENDKDHNLCSDYMDSIKPVYKPRYGCGKCQTAVPCEFRIPAK